MKDDGQDELCRRREGIAEQFAETHFELAEIQQNLTADASVPNWEHSLTQVRADLDGGHGDDTIATVLLSGRCPAVEGFKTAQSFASIADILAAHPEQLDHLRIWLL